MAKILIHRTETPAEEPLGLLPGELSIEMATPTRLWVGVPTAIDPTGKKLLNAAVRVAELPPTDVKQGDLWFESDSAVLWIWYNDGTSSQWVQINGAPVSSGATVLALVNTVEELTKRVKTLESRVR